MTEYRTSADIEDRRIYREEFDVGNRMVPRRHILYVDNGVEVVSFSPNGYEDSDRLCQSGIKELIEHAEKTLEKFA